MCYITTSIFRCTRISVKYGLGPCFVWMPQYPLITISTVSVPMRLDVWAREAYMMYPSETQTDPNITAIPWSDKKPIQSWCHNCWSNLQVHSYQLWDMTKYVPGRLFHSDYLLEECNNVCTIILIKASYLYK